MLPEICEWILENKLRDAEHTVTEEQWKVVCKCLNQTPYPLYFEVGEHKTFIFTSGLDFCHQKYNSIVVLVSLIEGKFLTVLLLTMSFS